MAKTEFWLEKITILRKRYYEKALKKEALLAIISETEIAEQVYNSNAIENSTLSLDDTEKILQQIELNRYISERELFEAKNLAQVVDYTTKKAKERVCDLELILFLHNILLSNIRDDIAGRFRRENEWVRVGNYIAVDPTKVVGKLEEMVAQYNGDIENNIIKKIAQFHLSFEHIHPFIDGNGRIGRALINYLLIRDGYVPINIKFIDRDVYYDAFREFDGSGTTKIMEEIVRKALTNSYHKRLAYLDGKEIIKLSEHAKKEKISHSNLINKAKRQTIEAFYEKGVWKIGI